MNITLLSALREKTKRTVPTFTQTVASWHRGELSHRCPHRQGLQIHHPRHVVQISVAVRPVLQHTMAVVQGLGVASVVDT
jgi:hypothetical protein